MIERLRVFEGIVTRARITSGRSKGIDTRKEIKSGDGLAAPSRFCLHLETANGAQTTGSDTTGLPNLETVGTVSRDFRKTTSTGKSLKRGMGHYLLKPNHFQ